MKMLVFHSALAPYRVDFFNHLAEKVDLEVVFLMENLENQKFDQNALCARCRFRFRYLTRGFSLKGRLFRFGVSRIVRDIRPDVVIAYEFSPLTSWLCLLRRFARWRLWTMCDDNEMMVAQCCGLRRIMRAFVLRRVDGVIVTGERVAAAFCARGFCRLHFATLPIVHDTDVLRHNAEEVFAAGAAWRRAFVPKNWRRLLLYVGRLAPEKNLAWLIAQMPSVPSDTGLVLVGDGSERARLERQVAAVGLGSRIRFAGRFEGVAVSAAMAVSDVLVLPSTSETFGAVVAEGLAWGTPVLVSDCVGAKSLVTAANGRVFSLNADAFAEALRTVPLPPVDRHSLLRIDLRTVVEKIVEQMTWNAEERTSRWTLRNRRPGWNGMRELAQTMRMSRELILYCMIGCTGATLDFVSYAVLNGWIGLHYQLSNFIGTNLGIINNFFLNRQFNFKAKNCIILRLMSFYAVGTMGWALGAGCLWFLIERTKVNSFVAKLVTIVVVTVVQFCLNKYVTFRKRASR